MVAAQLGVALLLKEAEESGHLLMCAKSLYLGAAQVAEQLLMAQLSYLHTSRPRHFRRCFSRLPRMRAMTHLMLLKPMACMARLLPRVAKARAA